jgi:thiol:disulfide interchange protein/DsbC/DsbD-like thiol-disulfide interchange protein
MSVRQATLFLLMVFAALIGAPLAAQERHLAIEIVPETPRPAAGSRVTLALASTPAPEWHAYWINGGDAGVPTTATWSLPQGVTAGDLRYPVPERLLVSGLMNYVYERPFAHLVDLTVPAGLAAGTRLPITLKLDYLVCTREICVPEKQTLTTELTVGDGAVESATRARFDAWRQAMPRPLGSEARYAVADGRFRLSVPYPAGAALGEAYFYPLAGGAADFAAPQNVTREGDALLIETKAAALGQPPARLEGVLAVGEGRGFSLVATPGPVAAATGGTAGPGWGTALAAFGGALLGGLLLNIMPCVFPILSLKALSLARSGADAGRARREALAYTAGVVAVCVALGAVILGLRAGGAATGWAFQLTDPRMVILLLLLATGIAMNLSGLFGLPTPRFAGESGAAGAFATGALAAFVATPCSGPFMAGAIGAALVLPAAAALAVFAGLGLGLALPFLLIGFVPALRRALPRPGAWMNSFRRVLAVPMWLTAIGLAWLLGRMAGVDGMTLGLLAALGLGLVLWWLGTRQHRGLGGGFAWAAVALVAVAATLTVPRVGAKAEATVAEADDEPFTEARLASVRGEGRPVFAYFTADWCLTCKVNEAGAIDRAAVRTAFDAGKVAVLVGDWTNGDPALGRFIERHNRAGVPLYLWYEPGAAEPKVLPQVLTPSMLTALADQRRG